MSRSERKRRLPKRIIDELEQAEAEAEEGARRQELKPEEDLTFQNTEFTGGDYE